MMHRGFTLLTAVVLSSVILTVALALLDVTYKQVLLTSTARQSQYAFYAADSVLECVLYYDQQFDAFNTNLQGYTSISCDGVTIPFTSSGSGPKTTDITVTCGTPGTVRASVNITKGNPTAPASRIYVSGYSACDPNHPRRVERGVKMTY